MREKERTASALAAGTIYAGAASADLNSREDKYDSRQGTKGAEQGVVTQLEQMEKLLGFQGEVIEKLYASLLPILRPEETSKCGAGCAERNVHPSPVSERLAQLIAIIQSRSGDLRELTGRIDL
jgi:hypothetical protein